MTLRVGIVGVGHRGRADAEGFQRVEETEVVAVADTASLGLKGPEFAEKYRVDCEESLKRLPP